MSSWRYTAEEVSHIILDIPGDGDASDVENMVWGEGDIVLKDNDTNS